MRALILDRTHAVLLETDRLPEVAFEGDRPLDTLQTALTARGLTLPGWLVRRARSQQRLSSRSAYSDRSGSGLARSRQAVRIEPRE